MRKHVLITGIAGFVGQHALYFFQNRGYDVSGLGITSFSKVKNYLEADLCDTEKVTNFISHIRPDYIINLAGYASQGRSFKEPIAAHQANYLSLVSLMSSITNSKVKLKKLLQVSTSEIYKVSERPIHEKSSLALTSPYATSKFFGEKLLSESLHNIPFVIARPFNHIGPGQSLNFFLPSIIDQIKQAKNKRVKINVGNIEVYRDFSAVEDIVAGYAVLLENGKSGEVYNLGSGNSYKLSDIIYMAAEIAGIEVEIEINPEKVRKNDAPMRKAEIKKIQKLGWVPQKTMKEILTNLIHA